MSTSTTQRALARFTRSTLREARFQAAFGDRRMARLLRAGVSDTISETRTVHPAPAPIDPELAKRRAIARAWAETMSVGMGEPPRPARPRS